MVTLSPYWSFKLLKNASLWIRGTVYAICIFLGEFISGRFLMNRNICPWNYASSKWNIQKVIRLDYFPNWFLAGLLFVSCQKEMKISRSDHSVTKELHDFSPVYIDKDKNGEVNFNQANRIGNTHWILTVDRELTLDDITPALQELTYRKFQKESNHEDTKEIYFVYSDTLNKQNAFVKLPFKEIFAERSPEIEPELTVKYIFDKVTNLDDFKQKYFSNSENKKAK